LKAQIVIDEKRARMLLDGKVVTVRIPANSESLQIRLQKPSECDSFNFAKVLDVFFNGRPA
jgi:hypothetical protein